MFAVPMESSTRQELRSAIVGAAVDSNWLEPIGNQNLEALWP